MHIYFILSLRVEIFKKYLITFAKRNNILYDFKHSYSFKFPFYEKNNSII